MNKFCRRSVSVVFLGFLALSPVSAEINDGIGHKVGTSSGKTPAMGANHPPVKNNHPGMSMGSNMGKGTMPANMPKMPEGPKKQGKVTEVVSGAGYSYMLIEAGGQKFWIAGTQITAKVGDVVSYVENVTMSNFTSKTLNKTFDQIIFVSTVAVVE